MPTTNESIARLEERMNTVERDIADIKKSQDEAERVANQAAIESRDLKVELAHVVDALVTHKEVHDAMDKRKIRMADIFMWLGMAVIALIQLVKG